ncbi:ParB/RepB/Spo0J family partition protein [Agromyces sp. NPDC058136]|uniref:ParB/RepB/Spo0J family partition protein n=1 Tax=Agromyces sp. NPDC058136 TaxID=3346354 RepID=UPI0036DA8E64
MTDTTLRGLHSVDLDQLTAGANVRTDLRDLGDLTKSIKANGIIQPPIVYPDPDQPDKLRILAGHRRIAAAGKVGLTSIEVVIRDAPDEPTRVVDQLVENVHRDALTDAEQADAYRQLALDFGVPAIQIAKRTAQPIARVGDAIKVASNPIAAKAATDHQLTIEDALVFDEFAGDDEALEQLTATVTERPEQLQHKAQYIRDQRADQAARQVVLDEITAKGIPLLDPAPSHGDKTIARLHELRTKPGYDGKRISEETIIAKAGDGLRAWAEQRGRWEGEGDDRRWVNGWDINYGVTNWTDHGWHIYGAKAKTGGLSDEEKAARRLARENGKLFAAATTVRRDWVKKFLERRTMPADWPTIPGLVLAHLGSGFNYHARDLAADYLGVARPGYDNNTLATLVEGNTANAPHALLALAIGQLESTWDEKQGWQNHTPTHIAYLRQLSTWGYPLADIEEQITTAALAEGEADA